MNCQWSINLLCSPMNTLQLEVCLKLHIYNHNLNCFLLVVNPYILFITSFFLHQKPDKHTVTPTEMFGIFM